MPQPARMLVPETAINEYHFAEGRKHKIGGTRQVRAMQTETISQAVCAASNDQLWLGVALPNFSHPHANRLRHVGKLGRPTGCEIAFHPRKHKGRCVYELSIIITSDCPQ
jgi:hypothetical protein